MDLTNEMKKIKERIGKDGIVIAYNDFRCGKCNQDFNITPAQLSKLVVQRIERWKKLKVEMPGAHIIELKIPCHCGKENSFGIVLVNENDVWSGFVLDGDQVLNAKIELEKYPEGITKTF